MLSIAALAVLMPIALRTPVASAQAACSTTTTPATTYGQVKQSVSVETAGTYRVWSRLKVPNTTNNSFYLQVDNGCAVNVGDAPTIPASTWTWVAYQGGNTTSYVDINLTAGLHQLTYTGKEADVQLDRVLLLTDLSCVPTGTGENCAAVDATNPTVNVTAPAAGSTVVAGTAVTINATASDDTGVTKVEFYVDGALKGTDTSSPYSYSWSTAGVTAGSHSLTARAYDTTNNTATSSPVSITVSGSSTGDTTPPTVTASVAKSVVTPGGSQTVSAQASDNVGVTKVEFILDGGVWHTDTSAPYSYTWNTSTNNTGPKVMSAKAYDAAGNVTESATVNYTVGTAPAGDTTNPTVSLTSPANGSSVTVGSTVNIAANASDNVGVAKVEFYRGSTLLGSDTSAPYSYSWNTTGLGGGSQSLTAKATDTAGNTATSAAAIVTVTVPAAALLGDANGDKRINGIDYSILAAHDGENHPSADFNKDGIVGAADLAILLSKWTW